MWTERVGRLELVREIVLSQVYRQSSQVPPEEASRPMSIDPENRLLWKMNRRRVDAESLLDSMLQASGSLDLEIGGSTIRKGVKADYDYGHTGMSRRAVYWPVLRNALPRIFEVFDFPNPSMVVGRRDKSSSAPQALFLLNNPFVIECGEQAAAELLARQFPDQDAQISYVFRQVLGRLPEDSEHELVKSFLGEERTSKEQLEAWTQVYQTLFGSLDFRHIP